MSLRSVALASCLLFVSFSNSAANVIPRPSSLSSSSSDRSSNSNHCSVWMDCTGKYHCGNSTASPSDDLQLECPGKVPQPQPNPPGECVNQSGICAWSNCTSWFNVCWAWRCGTQIERQIDNRPIPCPPYPIPRMYVPEPGLCRYNITAQQCKYKTNPTHPCKTAICPNGTKCEVDSSSGIAHCQPSCDINNGGCPQGSECSLVNATVCFAQPCLLAVKCISTQECKQWVDHCTGEHHCTAGSTNSTPPSCHPLIPDNLTPAPGVCTFINGSCKFVNPCISWKKECYSMDVQCTAKDQYKNNSCPHIGTPPPPKEECLPINGTCQQYNPCRMWPGFCGSPYQCITDIQYYRYTHEPQPECPVPVPPRPDPPGECIYQHGRCVWSNCTSWDGMCWMWECGTQYDEEVERTLIPPPRCPPPLYPPGYLPQPGLCKYNITAHKCNYITDSTHPCKTAICSNKTKCEEYPSSPRRSICQPSCDIQNGGCPHGDKCSLVNSTDCIVQPCPLTVKCTSIDPCTAKKCPVGHQCLSKGPEAQCVEVSTQECKQWVDHCTGEHHCTAGSTNSTPPSCHPLIPDNLTPAPGVCTFINGSCKFVNPCVTWNNECYGTDYQCTDKEHYHHLNCSYFHTPPPPKEECLPINGTCQQYNPCRMWPGFCGSSYQCITDIQYYRYTHEPQPECPVPVPPRPDPPGECIYQHGQCVWSNCTTWSNICWGWDCGTLYQEEVANTTPPPPCPAPPFPIRYLPKPGLCLYNISANRCSFKTDPTHPCKTAICPNNTKCEEHSTGYNLCQPSCDINNGGCPSGDKCSLINNTECFVQPCPLMVKCTAMSLSCTTTKCPAGHQCVHNGSIAQCVEVSTQECKQWVDHCTGEHHCTAGSTNSTPPSCHPLIPDNLTPAPGVCTFINGSCKFVNPCVTWNKECYGTDYQCTDKEHYHHLNCTYYHTPPPPKEECLPINGTCQQYNPCLMWPGFCGSPYQCITDIQYYRYTHEPPPECPVPVPPRPDPPGECIYQHGQCVWSNCTTWSNICWGWDCGTLYEEEVANTTPPPPCPVPPFPIRYLPKPGLCLYNISANRCSFKTDPTHPCKTAICPNNTKCEEHSTGYNLCQPSCDIDNGGCPSGDKCSLINNTECFVQPCPLMVKCTAMSLSCTTTKCPAGHQCVHNGSIAQCVEVSSQECKQWVDHCTGEHHCTAGSTNSTPPSCNPLIPDNLTPAPGVCTFINGSCKFVNPCVTWNKECYGTDYQCTDKEHYNFQNCTFRPPPPPPKEECLPINGTCQQYNPCRMWPGFCGSPYQCITDIQYYRYTHGPQPICPLPWPKPRPNPPGECIYQNGQCIWSNCTSFSGICWGWECITKYEREIEESSPPPPCPPPPYPDKFFPQPGLCKYNITSLKCNYITDPTHPCETAICPNNTKCVQLTTGGSAVCQGSCDINNGGCPPGEICSLVNTTDCFVKPCPLTVKCSKSIELSEVSTQECKQWVDQCTGEHHCTAGSTNSTPPSCHPLIPDNLTPAPGVCTFINGSCKFVNPCVTWNPNKDCYGTDYQCTDKEHYHHLNCTYYEPIPPPPKNECLPINGTCQQYNPCHVWPGFCGSPYQCITDIQYYRYTHEPPPECPVPVPPRPDPPGECIYQHGRCVWSNCTTFMDQCEVYWNCEAMYDYQSIKSYPPHTCPVPEPGFTPAPRAGPCKYNMTSQKCQFFADKAHPCNTAICPSGRLCQVYTPTNTAYCQPYCNIDNGGCKPGETCSLIDVKCFDQPCPPHVNCTPADPCAASNCPPDYQCIVDASSNRTDCVLSCARCTAAGLECVLEQDQCTDPPCRPSVRCFKADGPSVLSKIVIYGVVSLFGIAVLCIGAYKVLFGLFVYNNKKGKRSVGSYYKLKSMNLND